VADWEDDFAKTIFYIEKECNQCVDEFYPFIKLLTQMEYLKEHTDNENAEMNRIKRG